MQAKLRDILIEHIDGPQLYRMSDFNKGNQIRGAVKAGLLRFDRLKFPKTTILTDMGRTTLCRELAHWANALIRAEQRGIDILAMKTPDLLD